MAGAAGTHRGEVVVEFGVSRGYRVRCDMGRVGWGAWVGCETVPCVSRHKMGSMWMDGQANDVVGGARTKVGQNITRVTMTTTTGESIGSQRRWFRCFPDALPGPPASRSDRARASTAPSVPEQRGRQSPCAHTTAGANAPAAAAARGARRRNGATAAASPPSLRKKEQGEGQHMWGWIGRRSAQVELLVGDEREMFK